MTSNCIFLPYTERSKSHTEFPNSFGNKSAEYSRPAKQSSNQCLLLLQKTDLYRFHAYFQRLAS